MAHCQLFIPLWLLSLRTPSIPWTVGGFIFLKPSSDHSLVPKFPCFKSRILWPAGLTRFFPVPVCLRQAGTWDPVPQSLHLDTTLLELEDTKKLCGTRNNCVYVQFWQIVDQKIQRKKNPSQLPFRRAWSKNTGCVTPKQGTAYAPLHSAPQRDGQTT